MIRGKFDPQHCYDTVLVYRDSVKLSSPPKHDIFRPTSPSLSSVFLLLLLVVGVHL